MNSPRTSGDDGAGSPGTASNSAPCQHPGNVASAPGGSRSLPRFGSSAFKCRHVEESSARTSMRAPSSADVVMAKRPSHTTERAPGSIFMAGSPARPFSLQTRSAPPGRQSSRQPPSVAARAGQQCPAPAHAGREFLRHGDVVDQLWRVLDSAAPRIFNDADDARALRGAVIDVEAPSDSFHAGPDVSGH